MDYIYYYVSFGILTGSFVVFDDVISEPAFITRPGTCGCGEENSPESERIVGGQVLEFPNRYPWVVALAMLKDDGSHHYFCGGVLISRQHVLTAAHCIDNKQPSNVTIALGAHHMINSPTPVPVHKFIVHPDFGRSAFINDIALIELDNPVELEMKVNLVCLPPHPKFTSVNDTAVIAGWGYAKADHKHPCMELQELDVQIRSNALCQAVYGDVIQDTNICAGGYKDRDSCNGDSGGPLFRKVEGKWHTVGVVSWGISCGVDGYPGIYTRVSKYLGWIYEEIKTSPPCSEQAP